MNNVSIQIPDNWLHQTDQPTRVRHIEAEVALKQTSQYGVCLWWSDELPCWIHPDDVDAADQLVPGNRIFRRDECSNFADRKLGFSLMSYGPESFRALPAIWLPIAFEGFEVGDRVEIKSRMGRERPMIGTISDIHWNRLTRRVNYFIDSIHARIKKPFLAEDIQPAQRLDGFFSERELSLAARCRIG